MAVGASAGGLESLGKLLGGLPANFPAPILVVLHLDPNYESQAAGLLQHLSKLRVEQARSGVLVEAGTVYLAPPDHHLELRAGKLRLTRAPRVHYSRPSIDSLFASVAAQCGRGAVAIVLSGTGSDGTAGVAAIKQAGGLAVAEDASSARFPGMPLAAGRAGRLDAVLPVEQMPAFLVRVLTRRIPVSLRQWADLVSLVEARSGIRFSRYRSTTLQRRLQHRLAARGCKTMAAYLRILQDDPAELQQLRGAFLIKVSSFLRDPASWRALAREVGRSPPRGREGIRAWSAGCATGEEAFSLAMVLANVFGTAPSAQWKVFATDLDESALAVARAARYSDAHVAGVPKADLARYFGRDGDAWRVRKDLRDRVVFGQHDLLNDPPLSRIDVLACRNVLMYFTPKEKQRQIHRLAFALNPAGILFLGPSEAMGPVDGFQRLRHTTLFRQEGLRSPMAAPKKGPRPDDSAGKKPRRARPPAPVRARAGPGDAKLWAQQDLNDELQSRNEELETVNEELQSLNDEMSAMEEQMRGLGEESRRTNDFLRLLLDTSPDALIACDASNKVAFWNKAAIKRFRLSPQQAVGSELFELVPALDMPALRAASRKVRQAGRAGRVTLRQDGLEYLFDSLPAVAGNRRSYLLRVRPTSA